MKKMLTILASVAALALVFTGCTTVYTGEEYYSYSPKHKQNNEKDAESLFDDESNRGVNSGDWQNPLANDNGNSGVEVRHVYYDYTPMYVPVVVPWWYGYYGWMSYPYYRNWGPHFYIGFGYDPFYDWCWDWYSPWYNYHPYYGYYWPGYNSGWGYYGWFRQSWYAYDPNPLPRRNRDFGPHRRNDVNNPGYGGDEWTLNRRGFSTASNDYSSGVRTINSTTGTGYNRRSAVNSTSGDGYSRGNNTTGSGYNRTDSRNYGKDIYKRGNEYNNSSPNRTSESFDRTIETVKDLLNNRNSATERNSNSGSFNRRSNESSGSSSPTYNRSSEGNSNRSWSSPSSNSNRSSAPSYSAPSRSSSPGYSAPSRSSSGSSSGSSRSSGSNSGSNSSSNRRGR